MNLDAGAATHVEGVHHATSVDLDCGLAHLRRCCGPRRGLGAGLAHPGRTGRRPVQTGLSSRCLHHRHRSALGRLDRCGAGQLPPVPDQSESAGERHLGDGGDGRSRRRVTAGGLHAGPLRGRHPDRLHARRRPPEISRLRRAELCRAVRLRRRDESLPANRRQLLGPASRRQQRRIVLSGTLRAG